MVVPVHQVFQTTSRAVPGCSGIDVGDVPGLLIGGLLAEQRSRREQEDEQCSQGTLNARMDSHGCSDLIEISDAHIGLSIAPSH